MGMDFKIEGMKEFNESIERTIKQSPKDFDSLIIKVGKKVLENAEHFTPRVDGIMDDAYKQQRHKGKKEWILQKISKDAIEIGTTVFYAHMVEEGHKVGVRTGKLYKVRRGKYKGKWRKKIVRLWNVPGKFYFKKALEKTMNVDIPEMVDDFLDKVGRKAGFDVNGNA